MLSVSFFRNETDMWIYIGHICSVQQRHLVYTCAHTLAIYAPVLE